MVTAKEVCETLGIPRYALYRLVEQGRVPASVETLPPKPWHKPNGRKAYRFKLSEVRAALNLPAPPGEP